MQSKLARRPIVATCGLLAIILMCLMVGDAAGRAFEYCSTTANGGCGPGPTCTPSTAGYCVDNTTVCWLCQLWGSGCECCACGPGFCAFVPTTPCGGFTDCGSTQYGDKC